MKKNFVKIFLSMFLIAAISSIWADGVKVEDIYYPGTIKNSNGNTLVLNGAGLRTKLMFDVYTLGLYVPKKSPVAAEVLNMKGPKLVEIHMLRDVKAKTFIDALKEGLEDNDRDGKVLQKIQPQVDKLVALMSATELKKGDVIRFAFNPASGTNISINGRDKGTISGGDVFYNAILSIWIGKAPVDRVLKSKLAPE
ncbi:MAG TPA: chalcone isomerase family protein [Aquella sp.]|nr:chalcone isomerase family protein [Aquella sp.]